LHSKRGCPVWLCSRILISRYCARAWLAAALRCERRRLFPSTAWQN
jgi:hypothetical protein